ncbi:MAG TPA: glucose 1-dehydrogenase [Candidatus Dormibacteraeota bacterium]|nr:glucose 1-dehydrogenase [Candidatus Dormibacteraeota bacterium]
MATTMTATMRAVAVTPMRAGSARQVELPIPTVARGTAVMRVLEVGIDGTDTEINGGLYGEAPPGSDFLVIGHEALSVIEAVGEGVSGFTPGDLVVSTVRRPDDCPNCRAGESDMCLFGRYTERGIKGAHGYMGEYYAEAPAFMLKIPPVLRPFAVLLEPLSIVEKATYQAWKIQERMVWEPKRAVVLGAGPIGILCTILLRLRGLEVHVYAKAPPDTLQGRILRDLGASYASVVDHPVTGIKDELGQIDFMLEGTGNSTVAFEAMAQLGINGVLCLTGVSGGSSSIEIPADVINLQMVLGNRLAFGSVNANRRYFEMGVQHFQQAERQWPGIFERLITRRVPFDEFMSALDRRPEDIKTLLTIAAA